jgi:signal transduction histidine kinase
MSSSRPDPPRRTLGLRLASWYAAIFVVSAIALMAITYLLLSASLRQYDREIIQSTLTRYATAYTRGGVDALAAAIRRDQAAAGYEPLFVRAVGPVQDLVFLSPQAEWERFDPSQLATPALSGQQNWTLIGSGESGELLEVASVRLPDGTLFQVGKSTARRSALLRRFRVVLLLNVVTLVAIGLAGGAVFTASALQPLRELIDSVRDIMRTGRMHARVPAAGSGDALDELGVVVNGMLDRIEALIGGMRGALDNVAHDLRTPMMRLRGIAESALQDQDADAGALRNALADCLEESERVSGMLNTLMDISEAETGTMALQRETVNLADLVRQTTDLYEDAAEDKGITLETRADNPIWIDVDRNRLRQVLANLVDNAVKYTPPAGRVVVEARRTPDEAVVTVTDTGPGIPADELPRIWDRLYRGDKSRSERGLGLGLSLVRAIVQAHGGRVAVDSSPAGSRFTIHLPLGQAPGSAV